MSYTLSLYLEINFLCLIILGYMLIVSIRNVDKRVETIAFSRVTFATFLILIFDTIWVLIEGQTGSEMRIFSYCVNACYMFDTGVISSLWLVFTSRKINAERDITKRERLFLLIPLSILFVMSFASIGTHWIFYIDEANVYHRGPFYAVQIVISYGYLLAATLYTIYSIAIEKSSIRRKEKWNLASFVVLPIIGGVITTFFYGVPTIWPFSVLALLKVYINMQHYQISTDGLTGLNNRRQLDIYMQKTCTETHFGTGLFLLMMDINSFKYINDTFGHYEGDIALRETADILRQACRGRSAFLARYGGDEFAVLYRCETRAEAEQLKYDIQTMCRRRSQEWGEACKYSISISIGIMEYGPHHALDIASLISGADQDLYNEKRIYKTKHNLNL